ncbi:MAG TPA: M28 family peptidase [Thermoanaerobaculaceae bacterium]|nr:M28 family peptidase [Thermoanaerobaculaceae bacterium]HPS79092.1 M28 family peptidase [Thermoanaerobaculaceae bacterium]
MGDGIGWKSLLALAGVTRSLPIPAYSEFMPAPRLGPRPLGEWETASFAPEDPWGLQVGEDEAAWEIEPGLQHVADALLRAFAGLASGQPPALVTGHHGQHLKDNPYWPPELASRAAGGRREPLLAILPLALSRTQDDKGRVRWTVFGGSDLGPERAFWRSFSTGPDREEPELAFNFLGAVLRDVYGVAAVGVDGLLAAGLRVLPSAGCHPVAAWSPDRLPAWARPFLVDDSPSPDSVQFLLTFRPFAALPERFRRRYLTGELQLLPSPATLVPWGMASYLRLAHELPDAVQLPVLRLLRGHHGPGLKIPQSGWIHEPGRHGVESRIHPDFLNEAFPRTHRWERVHRHADAGATARVDRVVRALFSTALDAMNLYDKPLARNSQLWSDDYGLVLDGPVAGPAAIARARELIEDGGTFGYRFIYPAMRLGDHELFWHRPLAAYLLSGATLATRLSAAPLGVVVARRAGDPTAAPVELWPRLLARLLEQIAVAGFQQCHDRTTLETPYNLLALRTAWRLGGERPLAPSFARAVVRAPHEETLEGWLASLPARAATPATGETARSEIERLIEPPGTAATDPEPLTLVRTATREFEEAWWRDIATLAHGDFVTKDNADCVRDAATQAHEPRRTRDLDRMGDYLLQRYQAVIRAAGMEGRALAGELPFLWETDFEFTAFGGWLASRHRQGRERNLLMVIPGRNRAEAVVLGDHYDTAYMEDVYDTSTGGSGARLAARGADDNASATATLLQAAPILLDLSARGLLDRDVWLLNLTGEEFPSDCMGARAFCRALVERRLVLHSGERQTDLSTARVTGLVVMDMIGHNRDSEHNVFQIAPGDGPGSLAVARTMHAACESWNRLARQLNGGEERLGRGPGHRSADPVIPPPIAQHPVMRGEVRLHFTPASSLYNTDGQVFSDLGLPAVLLMEDYDISRQGYHDSHDTVENIDLDYGAALAAIAIETVARLAGGSPEPSSG